MKVLVKNHEGSFKVPDGYSSWLDYWEKKKSCKANHCSSCGCNNKLDGGHVDYKGHICLVPICQDCNNKHGEEIRVEENDLLFLN